MAKARHRQTEEEMTAEMVERVTKEYRAMNQNQLEVEAERIRSDLFYHSCETLCEIPTNFRSKAQAGLFHARTYIMQLLLKQQSIIGRIMQERQPALDYQI